MAVQTSFYSNTVTVGGTEVSVTAGGTTIQAQTAAGAFALVVDVNALAAGDEYEIAYYEKTIFGGTQRRVVLANLVGAQANPIWTSDHIQLGVGWDFAIKKIAGTDRSLSWTVRAIQANPIFEPATLNLTGWWRTNFSASPWKGNGSAGGSGSQDVSEATNPPAQGATVNGLIPPDFDGTNDVLSGAAISTFFGASLQSGAMLLNIDAVGTGTPSGGDGEIISDNTGVWAIGTRSSSGNKAYFQAFDTGWRSVELAVTIGSWVAFFWKHDGVNLSFKVDPRAAWTTAACGALSAVTGALRVGSARGSFSKFFNGRIADVLLANQNFSDATFTNIASYYNARYGLTL